MSYHRKGMQSAVGRVVLWATGTKSLDAILITLLLVVIAAAVQMLTPHLPGRRGGDEGL